MNKSRRIRIDKALILLEQAKDIIYDVMNEEDISFNSLSEGLQQTMRGEQMEENINEMEEVIDKLDESVDSLKNII